MLKKPRTQPIKLAKMFSALGDVNRLRILRLLAKNKDICVSEVAENVGITIAGISQHMKVLESAGLVSPERRGQKICYRINEDESNNQEVLKLIQ